MSACTRCWSCEQPITRALSVPTLDPDIRRCLECDHAIERRKASAWNGIGKQLALLNAWPEERMADAQ
jgi:hypothetical protein